MKKIEALIRLIRPHHWTKNFFLLIPFFFLPHLWNQAEIIWLLCGFASFSLISSAVYVFNDLCDRKEDKKHPVKKNRPLASGKVKPVEAFVIFCSLLVAGGWIANQLNQDFLIIIFSYVLLNIAYSLYLKKLTLIDVMVIAMCFILRLLSGYALLVIAPDHWLVMLSLFLSLFLGLAKRRDDIYRGLGSDHRGSLQGYNLVFLDVMISIVLGVLLVLYIQFTFDAETMIKLGSKNIWLSIPFVIYGVFRYVQLTYVKHVSGSPIRVFYTDVPIQLSVLGWLVLMIMLMVPNA